MKIKKKVLLYNILYFIVYAGINYLSLKHTFTPGPGKIFIWGILAPIILTIIFGKIIVKIEVSDLQKTTSIIAAVIFHLTLGASSIS